MTSTDYCICIHYPKDLRNLCVTEILYVYGTREGESYMTYPDKVHGYRRVGPGFGGAALVASQGLLLGDIWDYGAKLGDIFVRKGDPDFREFDWLLYPGNQHDTRDKFIQRCNEIGAMMGRSGNDFRVIESLFDKTGWISFDDSTPPAKEAPKKLCNRTEEVQIANSGMEDMKQRAEQELRRKMFYTPGGWPTCVNDSMVQLELRSQNMYEKGGVKAYLYCPNCKK